VSGVTVVVEPHIYGKRGGRDTLLVYAYGEIPAGTYTSWQLVDVSRVADVHRWTDHHSFKGGHFPPNTMARLEAKPLSGKFGVRVVTGRDLHWR
jgi:hypothetical protein